MQIVIPTAGRWSPRQQHTLYQLQNAGIEPTLVVQDKEKERYAWWPDVHVLPPEINTISPTRDYIIHNMSGPDLVLMLDDDLQFAVRREDAPDKFRQPEKEDVVNMLFAARQALSKYPHIGIASREGANRNAAPELYNTRIMRAMGYSRSVMREKKFTFAPMEVMEDFHVNLQFLRAGYDTVVLNKWVTNQAGGSAATGGCSAWRTDALQTAAAHQLAQLHPGFVRVVQKQTAVAWGGKERTDVQIQWKAARASAK